MSELNKGGRWLSKLNPPFSRYIHVTFSIKLTDTECAKLTDAELSELNV
jgi:hypothetical protein